MADEVVEEYKSSLSDLKINSKPLINMLTMLAEENKQFAVQFVEAIEAHVLQASPSEKLPSMYLIDSIIKNITDSNYLQLFSTNIVSTFVAVFEKVDEKNRQALYKLRQTWTDLFPNKSLYMLDIKVKGIDPAWPIIATPPEVPANIHVNPKFLLKQQQENEALVAKQQDLQRADEERLKMELLERKRREEEKMKSNLEMEVLLRQQLIAKQEILRLQEKRLELQLSKAKSHLELQAKQLQKEIQAKQENQPVEKQVKPTTIKKSSSTPSSVKTDPSLLHDPRIKTNVTSHRSVSSPQQLAVVLPTQSGKPVSAVAPEPVFTMTTASTSKCIAETAGNIFDRLQDLTVKTEEGSRVRDGTSQLNQPVGNLIADNETQQKVRERKNNKDVKLEKNAVAIMTTTRSPPKKQTNRSIESASKLAFIEEKKINREKIQNRKLSPETKTSNKSSERVELPSGDKFSRDSYDCDKHPTKPIRIRSPDSSHLPPSKFTKPQNICGNSSFMNKIGGRAGVRRNSLSDGRGGARRNSLRENGLRGSGRGRERQRNGRKRLLREDWSTKGSENNDRIYPMKRLKMTKYSRTNSISQELADLFGNEDQDYRCVSGRVHFGGGGVVPPRRESIGLLSPTTPSSQSSGWAQFKASRPEEFPFQSQQSRTPNHPPQRQSFDTELNQLFLYHHIPLLPTPDEDNVLATANNATGSLLPSDQRLLSGQQVMEDKQINDLKRLLEMKKHLDEQHEKLEGLGGKTGGALLFDGSTMGTGPEGRQFNELIRLQDMKRDLDEKQERLEAVIDSGMRISSEFDTAFPLMKDQLKMKHFRMHEESSRSPVYRDGSPQRPPKVNDHPFYPDGMASDKRLMDGRGLNNRCLLPTPSSSSSPSAALKRNLDFSASFGASSSLVKSSRHVKSNLKVDLPLDRLLPKLNDEFRGDLKKPSSAADENDKYFPERDPRWSMRTQMQDSRSPNVYNVTIDGRHYEMTFTNRPLKIFVNRNEVFVRLDPEMRQLWLNDESVYRLGEEEREIFLNGLHHRVSVQGPTKQIWIDSQLFDIGLDSPPEKINIAGKEHKIRIDGARNRIVVDGYDICPFGTSEPQLVKLAFVMHSIQFHPPCKQILIDGNQCNLDLSSRYPVVIMNGKAHGIRFDGPPHMIFIDDQPWTVPMDSSRRCHLEGPSSKPVVLAFGGPGHEVIVDDQWYEVKFNGIEKFVKIGRKLRKVQLKGSPPEVKILGEVIHTNKTRDDLSRRPFAPFNRPGPGGMRYPLSGLLDPTRQMIHRDTFPPESSDHIPSLLDIEVGQRSLEDIEVGQRSLEDRSFDRFPVDRSRMQPQQQQPVGSFRPRPMKPDPYLRDPMGQGQGPLSAADSCLRRGDVRPIQQQQGHPHNMMMSSNSVKVEHRLRTLARGTMPPQMGRGFDFDESAMVKTEQPYEDLCLGQNENEQMEWNVSNEQQEKQQPTVDVYGLLNKLLAVGLIKNPSETLSNPATAAAASQGEKDVEKNEKEETEDIPDLTDFNLDKLKKSFPGAMQRMYSGVQCPTCGCRFKSDAVDKYNEHLDWHFRKNRQEKDQSRVARFRHWYHDFVDWIEFEEMNGIEDRLHSAEDFESTIQNSTASNNGQSFSGVVNCPIASRNDKEDICDTCRESFEQFWDEEREAWHLKDAILVNGKVYHPICFEDVKGENEEILMSESNETNKSPNSEEIPLVSYRESGNDSPLKLIIMEEDEKVSDLPVLEDTSNQTILPLTDEDLIETEIEASEEVVASHPRDDECIESQINAGAGFNATAEDEVLDINLTTNKADKALNMTDDCQTDETNVAPNVETDEVMTDIGNFESTTITSDCLEKHKADNIRDDNDLQKIKSMK